MNLSIVLTIFGLFFGVSLTHASEIYRWTDSNGNIHFSDKKPKGQHASLPSKTINSEFQKLSSSIRNLAPSEIEITSIIETKRAPLVKGKALSMKQYESFILSIENSGIGYGAISKFTTRQKSTELNPYPIDFEFYVYSDPKYKTKSTNPFSVLLGGSQAKASLLDITEEERDKIIRQIASGKVLINSINSFSSYTQISGDYEQNSMLSSFLEELSNKRLGKPQVTKISPEAFVVKLEH